MIERLLSFSVIKTLNLSSSLFCLLLLLFLQLFSLCLKLWLDRPSVLASFLIGRWHPGSEAVIGRCGILLQSSGVLTLPDVRPAAGWQSSEPALRLDTQMHDEAEFLRGSSSVGFLVGRRSSQVKESERDRRECGAQWKQQISPDGWNLNQILSTLRNFQLILLVLQIVNFLIWFLLLTELI